MDIDLGRWVRKFPVAIDAKRCPDCGAWMTTEYVRAPHLQDHWRGVEAYVCQEEDCEYAEYKETVP